MDASRETMSLRHNRTDAHVNSWRLGEHVGPAQVQARQGTSTERGRKHRTLIPARSYLQLVHAAMENPVFSKGVSLGLSATLQRRPHAQE